MAQSGGKADVEALNRHSLDVAKRAASFLAERASSLESAELTSLAYHTSEAYRTEDPDALENVKGMLRHMIATSSANLAESSTHHAFCTKEMTASKQKLTEHKERMQKSHADLDKMEAELDAIKDKSTDLTDEIAKITKSLPEATEKRKKEHEAYLKLKEGFDTPVKGETEEEAEERLKKQIKVENKEADADFAFKRVEQDAQVSLASKRREVENIQREVVKRDLHISEAKRDISGLETTLAASKEYEEQIQKQCVVPPASHEDRKRRRDEQISSLKDAYEILSGDAVPVMSA